MQDWQRHLASRAKAILTQRLNAGDGRHWNQEANIWNLTLMAELGRLSGLGPSRVAERNLRSAEKIPSLRCAPTKETGDT